MKKMLFAVSALLLGTSRAWALAVGDAAPDFSLPNQDGKVVQLSALKGKPVLIYFYPKDDTPGCTKEACALRDAYKKYLDKGCVILGVSAQDAKSHTAFRKKHKLPFDLLVDKDGDAAKKFGVSEMMPGLYERKSVLVGADQKILRLYNSVNPNEHADEVLKDLDANKRTN